jgi:hypothetical protein
MDEITLFKTLQPPPTVDADRIREAARARLDSALNGLLGDSPGPARTPPRRRRRLALAAGAVAVAAGAAIAVPAILPAHDTGSLVTAAWAVQRNTNGTITVSVRQLRDPAGLERALRAEGVPAYVRYIPEIVVIGKGNSEFEYPECGYNSLFFSSPRNLFDKVFSFPRASDIAKLSFIIHPAAMPPGSAVLVEVNWVPASTVQRLRHLDPNLDSQIGDQFTLIRDGHLGSCVPNGAPHG